MSLLCTTIESVTKTWTKCYLSLNISTWFTDGIRLTGCIINPRMESIVQIKGALENPTLLYLLIFFKTRALSNKISPWNASPSQIFTINHSRKHSYSSTISPKSTLLGETMKGKIEFQVLIVPSFFNYHLEETTTKQVFTWTWRKTSYSLHRISFPECDPSTQLKEASFSPFTLPYNECKSFNEIKNGYAWVMTKLGGEDIWSICLRLFSGVGFSPLKVETKRVYKEMAHFNLSLFGFFRHL